MPSCSSISPALVRVSMFSAAFAMLVCGCPGPLYAAAELALHRRHVHDVLTAGRRRGHRRAQPAHQDERRGLVAQLHLEQFHRVDLVHPLGPAVHRRGVGQQTTGVDRGPGGDPLRRRAARNQGQLGHAPVVTACGAGCSARLPASACGWASLTWSNVITSTSSGGGVRSASTSAAYEPGGAAHRLGRVVDQDVQRALRGHRVGQRDDLSRVAQVDAHDAQPVQPVGAVVHRGEAAHGVVRKAGGDRRVRAVAQQPQRDVHADLGAPAGEQGAARRSGRCGRRAWPG